MSTFPDESDLLAETGESPDETRAPAAPSPASRLPLAAGILLAVVAEAFLVLALALSGGTHLLLVELGVPMISGLFALGSCLLTSLALQGRERGAWALLGLACLGVLVAQGARFVPLSEAANLPVALTGSYPSVASVALIAQSIGFFLALLLFPPPAQHATRLARLGQFFDGVLVVGAAMVAVSYFVLLPLFQTLNGALTAAQLTTLAVCGGDLLLLAGLTFALRSTGGRKSPLSGALGILALALLLLIGADLASIVLTPTQMASPDSPLQAVWNAGYLGIGLGAMRRLRGGGRKASTEEAAGAAGESSRGWMALPFVLVVVVAGTLVAHAATFATTSTEMLAALVGLSLLVALVGARYLIGILEARQMAEQRRAIEREVALAGEQIDQLRSSQFAQARARRESLEHMLDALTRFGYGDYQVRVGALDHELAPLAGRLNALFEGVSRQLEDRDRGREMRLISILTDALGRLALGELHDLPELPPPTGSLLDGLMMSVVQVRTRLMNLQTAVQQYEDEGYQAHEQIELARQELEQEAQAQRQAALEMAQRLEEQLQSERQVAQATEEQWQRERQHMQEQLQAVEARLAAAEAALHATEDRLLKERLEMEQRLMAERQALEERQRSMPLSGPTPLDRVRKLGDQLVSQFTAQAERLHTTAATLQTAAEVAQRLARHVQETAALPELQGARQAPPAAAPQPPAPRPLSAMQMLERLAGLRTGETTPKMPAVVPASADAASAPSAQGVSGPLDESTSERVARRLHMAANRAEEMAGGLLDLAQQCIQAGDESMHTAEVVGRLTADVETPEVPSVIRRTTLPARAPRSGR
jgi:hypothetical protein